MFDAGHTGKWCEWCLKPAKKGHYCLRACRFCKSPDCPYEDPDQKGVHSSQLWVQCPDCDRKLRHMKCFELHLSSVCDTPFCTACRKTIGTRRVHDYKEIAQLKAKGLSPQEIELHYAALRKQLHICGEYWCPSCEMYTPQNHRKASRCHIAVPREKKIKMDRKRDDNPCYIFFDFETESPCTPAEENLLELFPHTVNWAEAQYWNGERYTCDNIDTFCEWMLDFKKHDGYTMIAHNGRGFDFMFILRWICHTSYRFKHLNIQNSGTKALAFTISQGKQRIRFVDSMNFIQLPLAKLPASFSLTLPEEAKKIVEGTTMAMTSQKEGLYKGFYPYFFSKKENFSYRGRLPELKYFSNRDTIKGDFKEWYEKYSTDESFVYDLQKELAAYCYIDTLILRLACMAFYREMVELTGLDPFAFTTTAKYCMETYRTHHMKQKIGLYTPEECKEMRRALKGGRTNCTKLRFEMDKKALENGKDPMEMTRAYYFDINSLYPYVQYSKYYPEGSPIRIEDPTQDVYKYLQPGTLALLEVDVTCPKDLYVPVLPATRTVDGEKKLFFDLLDKKAEIYTSLELSAAIEVGYRVTGIRKVWLWTTTTSDMFKSYVRTFYKGKICAAGWPKNCFNSEGVVDKIKAEEFLAEVKKHTGLELKFEDISENVARKFCFKLFLNNLWGKFCQRQNLPQQKWLQSTEELQEFLLRNPTHDDHGRRIRSIDPLVKMSDGVSRVTWKVHDEGLLPQSNFISPPIGAFTTSWARLELYAALKACEDRLCYYDTDSVVFLCYPGEKPSDIIPNIGSWLGAWENELSPGSFISSFVSLGPKTYAYEACKYSTEKKTYCYSYKAKSKGFSVPHITPKEQFLSFCRMVTNWMDIQNALILGEQPPAKMSEEALITQFKRDNNYQVFVGKTVKKLQLTANKRVYYTKCFNPLIVDSYPIGHELEFEVTP